jgi:hypothetical protein
MQSENQKGPIPRDEISAIAGKILGREALSDDCVKAGVPVSAEKFNSLLADAKRLAGFVLNSDPKEGANRG